MYFLRISLLSFFFALAIFSCDNRKEVDMLQEQTEAIHDHAMADLADMIRTKTALRKELRAMDTVAVQSDVRDSILNILTAMNKANEDMSDWMLNYKAPDKATKKEQAIQYLTEQKTFMEKNAADISSATQAGKRCLEAIRNAEDEASAE